MALPRKLVTALKAGTYQPSAASRKARETTARINAERRTPAELAHDIVRNREVTTPQQVLRDMAQMSKWEAREALNAYSTGDLQDIFAARMYELFGKDGKGNVNEDYNDHVVRASAQNTSREDLIRMIPMSKRQMVNEIKAAQKRGGYSPFMYHNDSYRGR